MAKIASVVVLVGLAGFWYLDKLSKRPDPAPAALTGAAKDYAKFLKFVGDDGMTQQSPEMTAHESYFKQSIVEIKGHILNAGDRVLNSVEIVCVFYDPYGQVVLRRRVPIVSQKMGGLTPAESKAFRLAFDDVPESWNQAFPQMVIAGIDFR